MTQWPQKRQTESVGKNSADHLVCTRCSMKFSAKLYLDQHMERNHGQVYLCDTCDARICYSSHISRHLRDHPICSSFSIYFDTSPTQYTVSKSCDDCHFNFDSYFKKFHHMEEVHRHRKFKCLVCSKTLSSYKDVPLHKASHDGDATFSAEYNTPAESGIGKSTLITQSLDCSRCSLRITGKSRLEDHKEKDHGQCFLCDSCGMRFFRACDKKQHQQKHPTCETYTIYFDLSPSKPTKTRECDICEEEFDSFAEKVHHIDESHRGRKFQCDTCQKSFNSYLDLPLHKRTHKSETTFSVQYNKTQKVCEWKENNRKYLSS